MATKKKTPFQAGIKNGEQVIQHGAGIVVGVVKMCVVTPLKVVRDVAKSSTDRCLPVEGARRVRGRARRVRGRASR